MKIKQIMLVSLALALLSASTVWAGPNGKPGPNPAAPGIIKKGPGWGRGPAAPEIDAATATVPFALLTGIVLLMTERSRSRRSSKPE